MTSSQVSQAQATHGLFIRATSAWPNNVSTLATIGVGQTSTTLSNIATGYDRTLSITNSAASGTIVLATNNAAGFSATTGVNLKDFEGENLGTLTLLKGLLFRCRSGSANISGSTANVIDFQISSNGVRQEYNESGLSALLTAQTVTITATSANTSVQITAVGT